MDRYQRKIGCFIQIPNLGRGQLKYVGPVDTKAGMFAGVDLLANIGKNDGSFMGKKYFQTEYPQSGLFIQLQKVASLIEKIDIANLEKNDNGTAINTQKQIYCEAH
ncbi:BIK1p Microtubule-associated protein [Saccharomyces cerevisiae]|nr:BIK1p Microtubule-associated protein [Saccharomyces boulardii (nom. inval.)]